MTDPLALINRLAVDRPWYDGLWCWYCDGSLFPEDSADGTTHTADCPWVEARLLCGKPITDDD